MRRLLSHLIVGNRAVYIAAALMVASAWAGALGLDGDPRTIRPAFLSSILGTLFMFAAGAGSARRGSARAIAVLPLSLGQRGRAAWLVAVLMPAVVTTFIKAVAVCAALIVSVKMPFDSSWVLCSGVFDVAMTGTLCFTRIVLWPRGRWFWPALASRVAANVAAVVLLCIYLPVSWNEWNWWVAGGLVVGLALTTAGYLRSSRLALFVPGAGASDRLKPATRRVQTPPGDRLQSIRRILWTQFAIAVVAAVALLGAVGLSEAVFAGRWNIVLSLRGLVPLADFSRFPALPVLLTGLLTVASITSRSLQTATRALRVLPLGTWELNAFLIARVAVMWFAFWLVLVLADIALGGLAPEWSGVQVFAGLFGVTCLVNTAAFKWQSPTSLVAAGAIAGFTLAFGLAIGRSQVIDSRLHLGGWFLHSAAAAGIACLIMAAYWNHRLLTRSSLVYKRTTLFPESA